ncbi:MAG: hypothetical protein Q8N53_20395 [Longimicrobiales bacterium]|nr:hypothetical protein [Longimicrobiales bacterium]
MVLSLTPGTAWGQFLEFRQRDRGGPGVASSQFATFVQAGDVVVYPFYEYYRSNSAEYKPSELGYTGEEDYFGRYRAHEGLLFVGYGLTGRLLLEFEAAVITARQEKASDDSSDFPAALEQSGLGDVEAQLRYRWGEETETRPEIFGYFETVFPFQKAKRLIGTSSLELKYGMGLARSRSWGTTTLRASVAWADGKAEIGEYAVEYVRGVSDRVRIFAGIEGTQDEVALITEAQISLARNVRLKLNNSFGLTSKATGWAPEVGVMFIF